ncbi:MAG: elongation factor P maturation arginine rhamnosyltransferase EarP [Pigmentiphaga sp.]|uniref:elongation factor P maturation arginine rhamnosyltransferase EarP n=1 Tax=Pigmentiphaga sp. TaxID=1977564 RepID=UPI0029AEAF83|nr:elongation factor P maturation arginine rhamnosyltransferase EarP [Pigmentiphaga sp.]MDX3905693.1 elongation factor P maturation arginine rhamnosyltransferase EarP [Pigmentiphaga sp.]
MRVDIFCRIVDNYGDIGVCWRLARQLHLERRWQVRLWVDDLAVVARLVPSVDPRRAAQHADGLEVVHWTRPAPPLMPGDVVIEAFACDPPAEFVQRMRDQVRPPVWINLEYLSAEDWVESCHALPSPQPGGLRKYFFFPGFTPATGGLLREGGLLAERDALQADSRERAAFLQRIGLPGPHPEERLVTLFCYPDAPATTLADVLAAGNEPTVLAIPPGVAPYLPDAVRGNLRVMRMPFLPQPDYDRLLWSADLNFVRGEDSFVRAQWAGRPLVWHIYPQAEAAHVDKLHAWLRRYPAPAAAHALQGAWNGETAAARFGDLLAQVLAPEVFQLWRRAARQWSDALGAQADLATKLADFCQKVQENSA